MIKTESIFSNFLRLLLVLCINYVCVNSKLYAPKFKFNLLNFDEIRNELFNNHFYISSEINEKCFSELNAIEKGLKNSEEWAIASKLDLYSQQ